MNSKMKLVALAALSLSGAAFAQQTEVSVYGRANLSAEQQKVGGVSENALVDNQSRLGVRAKRDLGDGMSVGATLEAGVNFNNGSTTSSLFAREATAFLAGANGTVKLGRMAASSAYFATADYVSNHNHDTGTSADALYDFIATGSLKNAIGYTSPKIGNLQLEAQYGLKNGTGYDGTTSASVNPMALAANYNVGAMALGLGYERGQNFITNNPGDVAKQLTGRVFYTVGALGFGGYVQQSSGTDFGRTAYRLSAVYTVGKGEYHVNFGHAGNRENAANSAADQYTLAYNYNLDKQTKVYAFYTRVNQDSATKAYAGGVVGNTLSSIGAGVRYNF